MTSTSETGHAKNAANFQDLITFVTSYGTGYSPSKTSLKLPALNTAYTAAQGSLADVIAKNTAFNNTTNDRIAAFSDLRSLSTRLINALDTTEAMPEKIKNVQGFNRKLQGKRAAAATTSGPAQPVDPKTPAPKTISVSQLSYDQRIEHFSGLLATPRSEPTYTPNTGLVEIAAEVKK